MGQIKQLSALRSADFERFSDLLKSKIDVLQATGYHVEVQYAAVLPYGGAMADAEYSALVLGRLKS